MRDPICKAKSPNGWVEGYLVKMSDGYKVYTADGTAVSVEEGTIRFSTGRVIKGNKLFEKDIVRVRAAFMFVDWDDELFEYWLYYFNRGGERVRFAALSEIAEWECSRVLGNIFENEDLVMKLRLH